MVNLRKSTTINRGRAAGTAITALVGLMVLVAIDAEYTPRGVSNLKGGTTYERRKPESRVLVGKGIGGKGGNGTGGKGSSSSSSGSSGNSVLSQAYVDGEYYGCLALSEDQQAELRKSGINCDYTIHVNQGKSRTGKSGNKSSNSANNAATDSAGDTSGGDTSRSGNAANSAAENQAGDGDGYTLSYYYDDSGNGADGQAGNNEADANDQSGNNEAAASDQSGNYQATTNDQSKTNGGNNKGSKWYSWTQNKNSQGTSQVNENTGNGNSGVAQNSDGNPVVSVIDGDYESPYNAFDIEFCDTYENLWTWDLEISCGQTSDYHDCHCTFAEVLMDKGQLTCDAYHSCPSGCSICSNCLKLLGCDYDTTSTFAGRISHNGSAVAAAIALISLLIAGGCLAARNRKRGKLDDQLMDHESVGARGKVWMVPLHAGVPHESGKSMRPVWLAPDTQSVSTGASVATFSTSSSDYHNVNGEIIDLTEISSLDEKQRYVIRSFPRNLFPDVLAPSIPAEQELPPRGVPTAPTDMSGYSDPSSSDEEGDAIHLKNYTPSHHRQSRLEPMAIAESEDEDSEYTNSDATGSTSAYYSSQREVLDLPSLTGGSPSRVAGDPPIYYDPPGNRNTFSGHVYRTAN